MQVEVVTHCYRYPKLLTFHLSAYVLRPPKTKTLVSIYWTPTDDTVRPVLEHFSGLSPNNITWNYVELPHEQLMRRAIGRDMACRSTVADYLLLSDADYLLSGEVIDAAVEEMSQHPPSLCYPHTVMQSTSHELGDAEIAKVTEPGVYDYQPDRYTEIPLPRAIGGAQWIPRKTANEKGYLPKGHKFLNPEPVWRQTRCDTRARGYWGLPQLALDVRGVYRIRHSERGRENKDCVL